MKKSLLNLALGVVALSTGLSSFAQTYTFTNCAATGRFGPTQAQVNSAYTGGNTLTGAVTINTQGIQEWIVPTSANYSIQALGAEGGPNTTAAPGKGASMKGNVSLTAGDTLFIIVGQQGGVITNGGSGGGGGSYVVLSSANTPLVVAGGGMGGNNHTAAGYSSSDGGAITNTGTGGGAVGYSAAVSGGGGFVGDGLGNSGGLSFINGGTGGSGAGEGGFGGGGGKGGSTLNGACGGGGYNGGAGNNDVITYSGGGSFNSGTNQLNVADTNLGNGQVIITRLCTPTITCPSNVTSCDSMVTAIAPVVSGGCFGEHVTYTLSGATVGSGVSDASGSIFNIGVTTVQYMVTDSAGGVDSCSFDVDVVDCVGVNENASLNNLNIYPNPTNGLVYIKLGNLNGTINYSITTIEGRIINKENNVRINNLAIDLSNENDGVYLLRIEDKSSSKIYKLFKK